MEKKLTHLVALRAAPGNFKKFILELLMMYGGGVVEKYFREHLGVPLDFAGDDDFDKVYGYLETLEPVTLAALLSTELELNVRFIATDWWENFQEAGVSQGREKVMRVSPVNFQNPYHRIRLATIFTLEDIFEEEGFSPFE